MRRFIIAIVAVVLVAGCVTPMIPLPPPDSKLMSLTITDKTKGLVMFNYLPDSEFNGAYFFIFNENSGRGVIKQASKDGSLTSDPFTVKEGELLSVWVKRAVSEERSDIVTLIVDYSAPGNIKDRKN